MEISLEGLSWESSTLKRTSRKKSLVERRGVTYFSVRAGWGISEKLPWKGFAEGSVCSPSCGKPAHERCFHWGAEVQLEQGLEQEGGSGDHLRSKILGE